MSDLLHLVHDVSGVLRIKFVTNFPNDMTDDLLDAVSTLRKVSPYLHVPAQSGCDRMLRAMKRGYTASQYRDMLDRIRTRAPEATVSSDFIVGFPGEDRASFDRSADLVRRARFKNSFIFKYSPREGTKAFHLSDDVPDIEKKRRNNELLEVQNEISLEENHKLIGRVFEVLVEGPSKNARNQADSSPVVQMSGRTHADHIVVYTGNERQAGQMLPVRITGATPHTLFGEVVTQELIPFGVDPQPAPNAGVGDDSPL